jgi:dynein intermediate chain 3, axonemal
VRPTAISSLEHSQHDVITSIKWLAQNIKCDSNGRFEVRDEFKNRIFMTSSFDGTVCVWDLNWRPADSATQRKKNKFLEKMPAELQEAESVFKLVDKVFLPIFRLVLNLPVSCIALDEAEFVRQPIMMPQKITIRTRLQYDVHPVAGAFENRLKCGAFTCDLVAATWEGYEFDQGGVINEEQAKVQKFAAVHDGVIVAVERNPFIKTLDITVGGSIFALWSNEWATGPLLWRERPSRLTAIKWSLNRPAAFYAIREDGILEAWDLLAKCDRPILEKTIGGQVLTTLSQHIFHLPQPSLAIGDYNSSVRMYLIPPYFAEPMDDEIDQMARFVGKEILRKQSLAEWDSNWRGRNQELLAAKKQAQDDAHYAMIKKQRAEKDRKYYDERASAEAARRQTARDSKKIVYDLPDKLDQKWNEMHYKRLLNIIMERKSINQEELTRSIKPIKDKEEYESEKQKAFEANYAMAANELAKIRSTLLPASKARTSREDTVKQMLGDFLAYSPKYVDVAKDLEEQAVSASAIAELTFPDILMRGKQRREIISKSLGGATAHTYRLQRKGEEAEMTQSESSITKGRESSELKRRSVTFSMDVKSEKGEMLAGAKEVAK